MHTLYFSLNLEISNRLVRLIWSWSFILREFMETIRFVAYYHSVQNTWFFLILSKTLKIKIPKTIILPVILDRSETWDLTMKEQHTIENVENKMLRRIFWLKRDQVTGVNCIQIVKNYIICSLFHQCYYKDKINDSEMDGTCSMQGRVGKGLQSLAMLLWFVTPCRLVGGYQCFGETYCVHFKTSLRVSTESHPRRTSSSSPPREPQISL
jgi:hypothetical protein